jgi:hypothetical protein
MSPSKPIVASALLILACFLFRGLLEPNPIAHDLVQKPALALAGWIACYPIERRWPAVGTLSWNRGGATGVLIAFFTSAFWMLPRSIDWSINDPAGEVAKFISLPFLMGGALFLSWRRLPGLARCLITTHLISMLLCLSWVYSTAPQRLCSNYLLSQQQQYGEAMLWLACILSLVCSAPLFGVRFDLLIPQPSQIMQGERA